MFEHTYILAVTMTMTVSVAMVLVVAMPVFFARELSRSNLSTMNNFEWFYCNLHIIYFYCCQWLFPVIFFFGGERRIKGMLVFFVIIIVKWAFIFRWWWWLLLFFFSRCLTFIFIIARRRWCDSYNYEPGQAFSCVFACDGNLCVCLLIVWMDVTVTMCLYMWNEDMVDLPSLFIMCWLDFSVSHNNNT